jgi:hypothetical protein
MSDRYPKQINQGIQANTVHADVIAVGPGAKAIKYSSGERELLEALNRLRAAVDTLDLRPGVRARVDEDLGVLQEIAEKKGPDNPNRGAMTLRRLADELKTVGVVLSGAVSIAEPVRKIAELLRVPLHMLGL